MEFFVDNWLWFLVGGIIILMTLIGYIAEQTDFGRKDMPKQEKIKKENKEKKKEKKEKKIKENQTVEVEEPKAEVQIALATDAILEEPVVQETVEEIEDLNAPFGDVETNEDYAKKVSEPVEEVNDLKIEEVYTEPDVQVNTNDVVEDLNVPFGDVTFDMPAEPVEELVASEPMEALNLDDVNELNLELPDLDTVVTEEDDSDDVWKF